MPLDGSQPFPIMVDDMVLEDVARQIKSHNTVAVCGLNTIQGEHANGGRDIPD
jgi:hypothetical protein